MNDRRSYLIWLKKAMDRLTELYGVLRDEPMMVEEVYLGAGKIAYEAGERAMKLGLPELHAKSVELIGISDPFAVKTFLAECVKVCEALKEEDDWLTVDDAAARLKVAPRTVYRLCDEDKLPHQHIGSGRGTIRIRAKDLVAFEQETAEAAKPKNRITLEQLRST
jgi:excisionase family DNA binding protein